MKGNAFLIILILWLNRLNAQETAPELITDRPDQTESSTVVPWRSFQIETGFLSEISENDSVRSKIYAYNTTLLRYGLLDNLELRFGTAYMGMNEHFSYNDSTSFAHGFAPLYAGFKIQITREKRALPEIALLSALVLPFTAAESQRPSHTGVNLRLSVSHTLSEIFSLGYNLGVIWDGDTPVPSYYYSVALGISITQKLGAFAEGFGFLPEKGRASHLLDGGITYLVLPNLQLDVSGGIGLTEESPDYFLNCGLCLRLPR